MPYLNILYTDCHLVVVPFSYNSGIQLFERYESYTITFGSDNNNLLRINS